MFDDLAINLHKTAVEKGFWDQDVDDIFVSKQLMMIVSEVVEVLEAVRKDKGEEEIAKEFADIIICLPFFMHRLNLFRETMLFLRRILKTT